MGETFCLRRQKAENHRYVGRCLPGRSRCIV